MSTNDTFDWLIIGAGPAGIATVGRLLDHGIPKERIGWLDPTFSVGDLGSKWQSIPSNTVASLFRDYLHSCTSFRYKERKEPFPIDHIAPHDHCHLKEIATPLQWISDHLSQTVRAIKGEALSLNLIHGYWEVSRESFSPLRAKNVVLAIGAEPKNLAYSHPSSIPLEEALDPGKLARKVHPGDTIAVFGSSHSAILVLAHLVPLKPKMIYNFYRSPHLYALAMKDWILFDNTGLKGFAANWARRHLDKALPPHLERYSVSNPAFEERFALCNKVIYAVGFERRKLPVIEQFPEASHQETTGIIAPGLFGIGIAYPQVKLDPLGNREERVGLWKFMDYLSTTLPIWLDTASR